MARARPARLRRGGSVALVAPAGPPPPDLLDAGIATLESWGLRVTEGEHVRRGHPTLPYLAATDEQRAADLQTAWCDPSYDAVFSVRGGYGCTRMVDLLDFAAMAEAITAAPGKLFTGSSDATALHAALGHRLGVATVFGPMVATKAFVEETDEPGQPPPARDGLHALLFEPETARTLTAPRAVPLSPGRAHGTLVGGNLSLLAATCGGTNPPMPPPGSIALLEDITEPPYRVDGYLTQLRSAGWFDTVTGIALGSWKDCGDPDELRAVLFDRLAPLGVPIVHELGFGHCPRQLSVPLGVPATLDADAATITVDEPALG